MGVIIHKNEASEAPEFEDGTYPAKFLGLTFQEKRWPAKDGLYGFDNGDRYVFAFVLKTDDGPLNVDAETALMSTHPKSTFAKLLQPILSAAEWATLTEGDGADFDSDDIANRPCQVTITHKESGWPKVTGVLKAKKKKVAEPVAVADDDEDEE